MDISYLGHSCFLLRGREASLVTDPYEPDLGEIGPADIVTLSRSDPLSARAGAVRGVRRVIQRPGEYEVSGVIVKGIRLDGAEQDARAVAYLITLDEVVLCHLGGLSRALTASQVAELGTAQVVFVPVGSRRVGALNADSAAAVIGSLAPRVVVPIYAGSRAEVQEDLRSLEPFLREMGLREATPQARFSVTSSSLSGELQVVVLEPRGRG